MKYVQINSVPHGSTGGIMCKLHRELLAAGEDSYICWGRGRDPQDSTEFKFATQAGWIADAAISVIGGKAGFHSKAATKRLLAKLDEIDPDVVHLHNIHGFYLNIEMLFEWLMSHRCHVNWTLHDCWAFTGHCSYFTAVGCEQWKTECVDCCQAWTYPHTFSKASCKWNYEQKKRIFTQLPSERVTLITPSQWLADLTRESYLAKYPVEVRHNTIDATVFKPTESDFKRRHGLQDKFIVLGVAAQWAARKGLDDFIQLATELDDRFAVVLVGLSKKQIGQLQGKPRIVACGKTSSAQELAGIYTAADVFFNPTYEDNYPTTNLEAQACGTPVITYDTGGCAETVNLDQSVVVPTGDLAAAMRAIDGLIR